MPLPAQSSATQAQLLGQQISSQQEQIRQAESNRQEQIQQLQKPLQFSQAQLRSGLQGYQQRQVVEGQRVKAVGQAQEEFGQFQKVVEPVKAELATAHGQLDAYNKDQAEWKTAYALAGQEYGLYAAQNNPSLRDKILAIEAGYKQDEAATRYEKAVSSGTLGTQLESYLKTATPQQLTDYSKSLAYTMNNTNLQGTGLKAIITDGNLVGFEDTVAQKSYGIQQLPQSKVDVLVSRGVLQAPTMNVQGVPNINLPATGEIPLQIPNVSRNMPTGSYSYTSTGERIIPQEKIYIEPGSIPGFQTGLENAATGFFRKTGLYEKPQTISIEKRIPTGTYSYTPEGKAFIPKEKFTGTVPGLNMFQPEFLGKATVRGAELAATVIAWPYAVEALGAGLGSVPVIGARLAPLANEILISGLGISQTGIGVKEAFDTKKFVTQFSKDNPPLKYSDPHEGISDVVWKSQVDDYNKKLDSAISQAKLTGYGGAALNTLLGLAFIGSGIKGMAFDKTVGMKNFLVEDYPIGKGAKAEVDYLRGKGFTDAQANTIYNKLKNVEGKEAISKIVIKDAKAANIQFSPGYEMFITTKVRNLFNMDPVYAARNYAKLADQSSSIVFKDTLGKLEIALSKAGYSNKVISQILSPEGYQPAFFSKTIASALTPQEATYFGARVASEREAGNALWNVISTPKSSVEQVVWMRTPKISLIKTPEVSDTSYMLGEKVPWGLRGLKPLSTKPTFQNAVYYGKSLGLTAKFKSGITTDKYTSGLNKALGIKGENELLDLQYFGPVRTAEGKVIRGTSGFAAVTKEKVIGSEFKAGSSEDKALKEFQRQADKEGWPKGVMPVGLGGKGGGTKQVFTFVELPGRITAKSKIWVSKVDANIVSSKQAPIYGAKFKFDKSGAIKASTMKLSPNTFFDTTIREVVSKYGTRVPIEMSKKEILNTFPGVRGSKVKLGVSSEADLKIFRKLYKDIKSISISGIESYTKKTTEVISPRSVKLELIGTSGKEPSILLTKKVNRATTEVLPEPFFPSTRSVEGLLGNKADLSAAATKFEPTMKTIGGKELSLGDYSKYQKSPFYKGYIQRTNAGPQVSEEVLPSYVGGKGGAEAESIYGFGKSLGPQPSMVRLQKIISQEQPVMIASPLRVKVMSVKVPQTELLTSFKTSPVNLYGLKTASSEFLIKGYETGIEKPIAINQFKSMSEIQVQKNMFQTQFMTQAMVQPMLAQTMVQPMTQTMFQTQFMTQAMVQPMFQTQVKTQTQVRPQVAFMPPTQPSIDITKPRLPRTPPRPPKITKKVSTLSYKGKPITKAQTGFTIQVKSKKKFGTPFNISVPKEEAFAVGAAALIKSASASFKIIPSKLPYRPTGIRPTILQRAVIHPGKQSGTFVQKERLRIISQGEVREISNVGAAARRAGTSKSKSNSMWGF